LLLLAKRILGEVNIHAFPMKPSLTRSLNLAPGLLLFVIVTLSAHTALAATTRTHLISTENRGSVGAAIAGAKQTYQYPVVTWNNWQKEAWRRNAKYVLTEGPLYYSHAMDIMDPFGKNVNPALMQNGWTPPKQKPWYSPKMNPTGQESSSPLPWPQIAAHHWHSPAFIEGESSTQKQT